MYVFIRGVIELLSTSLMLHLLGFGVFACAILSLQRIFKI